MFTEPRSRLLLSFPAKDAAAVSRCMHADIHVCRLVDTRTCLGAQARRAHAHTDCWQAKIVTMTSGSAPATVIGQFVVFVLGFFFATPRYVTFAEKKGKKCFKMSFRKMSTLYVDKVAENKCC